MSMAKMVLRRQEICRAQASKRRTVSRVRARRIAQSYSMDSLAYDRYKGLVCGEHHGISGHGEVGSLLLPWECFLF